MRVLITGSRDWTDENTIVRELHRLNIKLVTLVHGACPTGADEIASRWWDLEGGACESHPANWVIGKQAGFVRNAEMVALGADLCLAFIKNESKGATMCADLAEKSGIRTLRFVE